jgi:hypothetical protein
VCRSANGDRLQKRAAVPKEPVRRPGDRPRGRMVSRRINGLRTDDGRSSLLRPAQGCRRLESGNQRERTVPRASRKHEACPDRALNCLSIGVCRRSSFTPLNPGMVRRCGECTILLRDKRNRQQNRKDQNTAPSASFVGCMRRGDSSGGAAMQKRKLGESGLDVSAIWPRLHGHELRLRPARGQGGSH